MLRSGLSINDLAQACAHSANAAEWEEFLRRVTPLATMVVMRVARLWMNGSALPAIDDIVQEILIKLCEQERRVLREFVPRGEDSFLGLLRTISASAANDYFRRLHSAKRGGKVVTTSSSGDGVPALESVNGNALGIQKSVLFSQLDRRLESAPGFDVERDRNLFWLYYLQGLTAEEIAAIPAIGLTPKGVESALRRISRWLRNELAPKHPEPENDQSIVPGSRFSKGKLLINPINTQRR